MHQKSFSLSVAPPLYELGDLIVVATEGEEGIYADFGYIKGLECEPSWAFDGGWWYSIQIIGGTSPGLQEWVPEEEIAGRVIHGRYGYEK